MEERKFKPSAVAEDIRTLKNWAKGAIPAELGARSLARSNGWEELTDEEFIEIAHSFGYYRKTRNG